MTDTELEIMLRLPSIMRWQIVRVYKNQSVAEHSYRVWLLATHLYDAVFTTPHNSFERELVQHWALLHDVDEVLTGDIPSTVKTLLEEVQPGIVQRFTDRVMVDLPTASEARAGIANTVAGLLVKIADNVEAILYLQENGMGDTAPVIRTRMMAIEHLFDQGVRIYSQVEWWKVSNWIAALVNTEGSPHE